MTKKYTFDDIIETRNEERERIRIILEYIMNKNSRMIREGGFNHDRYLEDIQDLEDSLIDY